MKDATATPDERKATRRRNLARRVGPALVVLALFTVAQGAYFAVTRNEQAEQCAEYNRAVVESLTDARQIANQDRAAVDRLFTTIQDNAVGTVDPSASAIETAFNDYFDTRRALDEERKRNPPPSLEGYRCG